MKPIRLIELHLPGPNRDVRIAATLNDLLRMPLEEMISLFKEYAFYESEYTPMVRSILKTYGYTHSLHDKQRVALAMYLASHPHRT